MKYAKKARTVAIALALLCGACGDSGSSSGQTGGSGGGSSASGNAGSSGGGAPSSSSKAGGSGSQAGATASSSNAAGAGGSSSSASGTAGTSGTASTGGKGGASSNVGGTSATGGTTGKAGSTASGGATPSGGASSAGGTTSKGGGTAGATAGTGGSSSSSGGAGGSTLPLGEGLPCDILEAAKAPCVGAYSMVRAIYKSYSGPAYQVRSKTNTSSTKDIPLLEAGGIADSKVQDDFCASGGCTVSKIYDQSPKGNHLALSPDVFWLKGNQKEADVKNNPKITVGGKPVYGLKSMGGQANCYRVLKPTGTAVGDEAEYIYSVFDTTVYNGSCCNDFGNAETTGNPDSFSSMEAIYYGNATMWGKGGGNGPWFSCDYEAVISPGKTGTDTSIPSITIKKFATFIIKGYSGGTIALKFGDAEKGPLTTQYEGSRVNNTKTMKKQGSIILASGGDGSFYSTGVWFEGAITKGCPDAADKATDEAIQTNIVNAKFSAN
jgi:non-reducing end alpha-L-arabinofuranosidase